MLCNSVRLCYLHQHQQPLLNIRAPTAPSPWLVRQPHRLRGHACCIKRGQLAQQVLGAAHLSRRQVGLVQAAHEGGIVGGTGGGGAQRQGPQRAVPLLHLLLHHLQQAGARRGGLRVWWRVGGT